VKTAIQLDFDGTVTEEDVSFLLLDKFVGDNWRPYLEQYSNGKISVAVFNKKVFGMVKADEKTMTDFVLNSPRVKTRRGLWEFFDYCKRKGIRVIIVSNGLMFYIEAILKKKGISGIEIHAAENDFSPEGMKVRYIGPDGREVDSSFVDSGFKEAYTDRLVKEGYQVFYIGDGNSDIYSARKAKYICATLDLLKHCEKEDLNWYPFEDFLDVLKELRHVDLDR
jgi:2-hydroxy-3-keto-5-methylthiopentenyl-1-phosphate phosphatase